VNKVKIKTNILKNNSSIILQEVVEEVKEALVDSTGGADCDI